MSAWLEQLCEIVEDFECANVISLKFMSVDKTVKCYVTVRNADKQLVTWELVDDGVSSDRWREVTEPYRFP